MVYDWMAGRIVGWMDGRMDGWIDGRIDGWMHAWMADAWMDGWMDGSMDGWKEGRKDGWMDAWIVDGQLDSWTVGQAANCAREQGRYPAVSVVAELVVARDAAILLVHAIGVVGVRLDEVRKGLPPLVRCRR